MPRGCRSRIVHALAVSNSFLLSVNLISASASRHGMCLFKQCSTWSSGMVCVMDTVCNSTVALTQYAHRVGVKWNCDSDWLESLPYSQRVERDDMTISTLRERWYGHITQQLSWIQGQVGYILVLAIWSSGYWRVIVFLCSNFKRQFTLWIMFWHCN